MKARFIFQILFIVVSCSMLCSCLDMANSMILKNDPRFRYITEIQKFEEERNYPEAARFAEMRVEYTRTNYFNTGHINLYFQALGDAQRLFRMAGNLEKTDYFYRMELDAVENPSQVLKRSNHVSRQFAEAAGNMFVADSSPLLRAEKKYLLFLISTDGSPEAIDTMVTKITGFNTMEAALALNEIRVALAEGKTSPARVKAAGDISRKMAEIYETNISRLTGDQFFDLRSINSAADVFFDLGKYEQAEKILETVQKKVTAFSEANQSFGELQSAMGIIGSATNPEQLTGNLAAVEKLARCYYYQGKTESFVNLYREFEEKLKVQYSRRGMPDADENYRLDGNPQLRLIYQSFGEIFAAMGDRATAHDLYLRASKISVDQLVSFSILFWPEEWRNEFIVKSRIPVNHLIVNDFSMGNEKADVGSTFNAWASYKGLSLSFDTDVELAMGQVDDSQAKKLFKEYLAAKRKLADKSEAEIGKSQSLQTAYGEMLNAKINLNRRISSLRPLVGKISTEEVFKAVPADSIYLDFARVTEKKAAKGGQSEASYYAFAVNGEKRAVRLIRIGNADEIDQLVQQYHAKISADLRKKKRPDEGALATMGRDLYEKIFKPLEPALDGKTRITVSPDGSLNLIPFEVFVKNDKYLVEQLKISYAPSARELLRRGTAKDADSKEVVIISNPDFDLGGSSAQPPADGSSSALRGYSFLQLPDTGIEAEKITGELGKKFEVNNYSGKNATEERLFSVKSPKVLHIATHGFYLKNKNAGDASKRSGLILAGGNTSIRTGATNGILTAEKLVRLPLAGTELVTLSACDTGLGEVPDGDGVFGIERAFLASGASSVLVSLWDIPSAESVDFMVDFYRLWGSGLPKAEALLKAKQQLMKDHPNPYFWGAFVLVGSPT